MKDKQIDLHRVITVIISIVWMAFQTYIILGKPMNPMLQVPVHLVFAMAIIYLYNPIDKKNEKLRKLKFLDYIFYAGILFLAYYYICETVRLQSRVPYFSALETIDIVAFFVLCIVLLEAVRRTLGWNLIIFIAIFVLYALFGQYLPRSSGLRSTSIRPLEFVELISMSSGGILGTPLTTSATYLFYFMIFGALFSTCGGGQLLIEIGLKFGKGHGGPAKAAVISSGLLGMVSGSAVGNVSTTGVMTIPMMKKVGYTPEQAGAIEAVASTGGQIMPPIMGIGAFIMAEMLGVHYMEIAKSAIVPALAYYLAIFLVVDFIARKNTNNIESKGFNVQPILPRIYLLLPAIVLVYFIITGMSLMRSAAYAIAVILVLNIINPKRAAWKDVWNAMLVGCKQAASIAIPTAAVGIIIGVVVNSGLATKLSSLMMKLGSSGMFLALVLSMIGCMLLGMALPTVAAYMIANILFVPTLTKLGVDRLAANMFVFYFGIFAQITPPVCLASFTAAGIAGGDSWKTGWTGFRYSIVAFLAPYAFVYNTAILLIGSVPDIIQAAAQVFLGTFFLAAGVDGFVGKPVKNIALRILLVAAGALIIIPEVITTLAGYALGIGIVVAVNLLAQRKEGKKDKASELRLAVTAVSGALVVTPEIITTVAGLCLALAMLIWSKRAEKKQKKDVVYVEAGEVLETVAQDIDED